MKEFFKFQILIIAILVCSLFAVSCLDDSDSDGGGIFGNNNNNSHVGTSSSFTVETWYGFGLCTSMGSIRALNFVNFSSYPVNITINGETSRIMPDDPTLRLCFDDEIITVTYSPSNKVRHDTTYAHPHGGSSVLFWDR
jgi:hypothetical protein